MPEVAGRLDFVAFGTSYELLSRSRPPRNLEVNHQQRDPLKTNQMRQFTCEKKLCSCDSLACFMSRIKTTTEEQRLQTIDQCQRKIEDRERNVLETRKMYQSFQEIRLQNLRFVLVTIK